MIDMLTMWFWAYVIGVFLAAAITIATIIVVIGSMLPDKKKYPESALDRWKRGQ